MQLITDRTAADVLLQTAKGCYSHEDLNRVEQAVEELLPLLPQLDLHPVITTKHDWAPPEAFSPETWPTAGQMNRYLQNIYILCRILSLPTDELPAGMAQLTWQGANAIEQALERVQQRIQSILRAYLYSGELIAGEETTL